MPRVIDAFTQFFDDNGNPLVDGWLAFKESGTNNTDKDTFADINEEIPNTNPVQLSGAGRCPNIFGTGTYNAISYTDNGGSPGTQIQQFDPVNIADTEGQFSDWDSVTTYSQGDLVIASDDKYYRSLINNNENQDPTTSPGQWEEVQFLDVWNTNVTYAENDIVLVGADFYTSLVDSNTGNIPSTSPDEWFASFTGGTVFAPSLREEQIELIAGTLRQQVGVAVTITAVTTTATVDHIAHGYTTGRYVNIKGAVETDYNGYFQITVIDVDTYTYTMGGSPTSPATGTITGRSPEQWDWINTPGHVHTGVDSSQPIIATSPYILEIPFIKTYTKALSIVAGPDEELASRFGMSVGPSVSNAEFSLKMSISRTLAAGISYNGASWDIDYGFNQGGTDAGMVNITDATFDGTRLILTHDAMLGDNIQVSPQHISGVTVAYIPVIESRTTIETRIRFINPSVGLYSSTASVDMSFQLSYNYNSDYPWNGSSGDADALEFEDGNIWFIGAMQV